VNNKGEKTFIEILAGETDDAKTASRSAMGTHVNQLLCVNALKHMDEGDDGYVVLDLFNCALATILVAVADFVTLCGGSGFLDSGIS
jgi:hypothetical protein